MLKPAPLLLLQILLPAFAIAQTPAWQWVVGSGGNRSDKVNDVCVDADGNAYATGGFQSNGITFGPIDLDNTLSNNTSDAFLVKFDPSGSALWAVSIGGTGHQNGMAVAATPDDGVVMAMTYQNTVTVGSETHTAPGGSALLVVKFNGAGEPLWSYSAGGEENTNVYDVAVSAEGKVAVCGTLSGNGFSTGVGSHNSAGNTDIYVIVLDGNGDPQWSAFAGSNLEEYARAIAFTSNGDVVVGGDLTSAALQIAGSTIVNANDYDQDIFIARYDANGNGVWGIGAGTTDTEALMDLAVNDEDQIVIIGTFDAAEFDLFGTTLTNASPNVDDSWIDHFVAKLGGDGSLIWATSGGGQQHEFAKGVAIDEQGYIHLCGDFESPEANFGTSTIAANGGTSPYVVKYTPDGAAMWAVTAGGAFSDHCEKIAVDASGGIVVGGWFNGALDFGSATLQSSGDNDAWIARLGGTVGIAETAGPWSTAYVDRTAGICSIRSGKPIDELQVIDAAGRIVLSEAPRSTSASFTLQTAGAYLIHLRSGDLREVVRVVR